ncbi:MAG: hypothetical protein VW058_09680 [Flavobacteriaceae bacterium]
MNEINESVILIECNFILMCVKKKSLFRIDLKIQDFQPLKKDVIQGVTNLLGDTIMLNNEGKIRILYTDKIVIK